MLLPAEHGCCVCCCLLPQDLEDLIAASGYLGPLIFAGSYAAATVLLFPASLLTLGAGYLFGEQSCAAHSMLYAVPKAMDCCTSDSKRVLL
jgi:hypothetical protein